MSILISLPGILYSYSTKLLPFAWGMVVTGSMGLYNF